MSSKQPICPFLKKPCIEHDCMLYAHVTMVADPQSGASRDDWVCAIALLPTLLIEGARQTRNAAASVDSMRNEVVQRQDILNAAINDARSSHEVGRIEGNVIHYPDGSRGLLPGAEQGYDAGGEPADSRDNYR